MSAIELDFINLSLDLQRSDVAFFQRNLAASSTEEVVVWKVIRRCGHEWHHPFAFPLELSLEIADERGNRTLPMVVEPGRRWTISRGHGGALRAQASDGDDPASIQVVNGFATEVIHARLLRGSRLVAPERGLFASQTARYRFDFKLSVAAVRQAREGEALRGFELENCRAQLDLLGLSRAEIIMVGGGTGPAARALSFHLRNQQTW